MRIAVIALALLSACRTVPRVERATFPGSIAGPAQERAGVRFQDGAAGFAVPGGAVWTFGDTFLEGELRPCTIALWRDGELEYRPGDDGRADFPFDWREGESLETHRIWPGGGIHVDGRNYLFYALIEITEGEPPWNFRAVAGGLARSDEPLGRFERLAPGGDWRFPITASHVERVGEWYYLYEATTEGALLARTRDLEDPEAYEWWSGGGYGPREEREVYLRDSVGQVSVARNGYLGGWVMACSSNFARPDEIVLRFAEAPDGRFEEFGSVRVPDAQGQLIYCSYLHPEEFREDGRVIVVTYCRMGQGWFNPERAVIELVR